MEDISKHGISQARRDVDALLSTLADAGGQLIGFDLSEDPIVSDAHALGLVEIYIGDGWGNFDTVRLAPGLRSQFGLAPIID